MSSDGDSLVPTVADTPFNIGHHRLIWDLTIAGLSLVMLKNSKFSAYIFAAFPSSTIMFHILLFYGALAFLCRCRGIGTLWKETGQRTRVCHRMKPA